VAAAGIDGARFPETVGLSDRDAWGIAQSLRLHAAVTTEHESSAEPLPGGTWPEPTRQLIALPLTRVGGPPEMRGILVAGVNSRLRLDDRYLDFLRLVAAELAGAISTLQALEREKEATAEMDLLLEKERAARADAERAARLKDEFLAILSHELRTPLNAVLGWAQILRQDLGDPQRSRMALEVIERNARAQSQLITDLLDVSRIVSGNMHLEIEPLDLLPVIDAAIASLRPTAEAKGVTIENGLAPMHGAVRGDAARLQQVVWNLLSNAVKFSKPGGRVVVRLVEDGDHATISVADDGAGISPDFLPHLFERFRQADATPSRAHGGLGLGLSIVKQLVDLHGGSVGASSDGPERGATFTVELPLASGAAPTRRPEAAPTPGDAGLHGVRVLVLDDEPDALTLIQRVLEENETVVRTAATPEAALDLLGRDRFDVIVSDIAMPGRDGYAFIAEVRARGIPTPALALTAFARVEDRRRAIASGYQAHVAKPVDRGEFLAALASLAAREGGVSPPGP
jgi:signal transduction histidine kinase/ActR/RegA family two-component response regulator